MRRAVETVNSYLRRINPTFRRLELPPGETSADLVVNHRGVSVLVNVGVERDGVVSATLLAPMFKEPVRARDRDLARLYRTLLLLGASTFMHSGSMHVGIVGEESKRVISLIWSKPAEFLGFEEYKYALDMISERCGALIFALSKDFSFLE